MARNVNDEDVAYPPSRSQASTRARHGSHELVGMQAAFHQQLALPFMHHLDGPGGRRLAMTNIHDPESVNIKVLLVGDRGDPRGWPHEGRNDNAFVGRLYSAPQRRLIARVHDKGCCGGHFLCTSEQTIILTRGRLKRTNLRHGH